MPANEDRTGRDEREVTRAFLETFDQASARQRERERRDPGLVGVGGERGWKREDLYERGRVGSASGRPAGAAPERLGQILAETPVDAEWAAELRAMREEEAG
jgi:hypothetical protein